MSIYNNKASPNVKESKQQECRGMPLKESSVRHWETLSILNTCDNNSLDFSKLLKNMSYK